MVSEDGMWGESAPSPTPRVRSREVSTFVFLSGNVASSGRFSMVDGMV